MLNIQRSTIKLDEKSKLKLSSLKNSIEFLSSEIERLQKIKEKYENDVSKISSLE